MSAPHYFAYGSNMSSAELLAYCPSGHCLGIARLDGWRLGFTVYAARRHGGVADILPLAAPGELSPVWGVLWSIPEEELPALHAKEGYDPQRPDAQNLYTRVELAVTLLVDQPLYAGGPESPPLPLAGPPDPVPAFAYQVVRKAEHHIPPSRAYLDLVLSGAREHGLPGEYTAALARVEATD
jgi:hypothetical protein